MTKHRTILAMASLAALVAIFSLQHGARADIFQWQYINSANPELGKQQSTILTPGGAGANAVPGADLTFRNLTRAYLIRADVRNSNWSAANLTNADLSQANLTNAIFSFYSDDYSTYYTDLTGATLTQANLTNANFVLADLTGANLGQANITNADFQYATITGANLSRANLANANLNGARLTGSDFSGTEVRGAKFDSFGYYGGTGISPAQLQSTASYQAHDLSGISMSGINLTGANFAGQNLTNASLRYANLTNVILSQTILTGANFDGATLTGANLTGAEVRGVNLGRNYGGSGITQTQLYSTASYVAHDLTGIGLSYTNLTAVNFANQILTNADLTAATLTGANLTGATVRGANFSRGTGSGITTSQLYSTASYLAHDLRGIGLGDNNLSGANFANQNLTNAIVIGTLTNANFSQANLAGASVGGALTGANFSGAEVRGANVAGLSAAQLYSTASYLAHDMTGIRLDYGNFGGVNFAGQNLTNASLRYATLVNGNLGQANITNANFAGISFPVFDEIGNFVREDIFPGANLTNANLSATDARGANFQYATLTGADTNNLIQFNGHIAGLNLTAGKLLIVRDYDGNSTASPPAGPLPIVVDQHLTISGSGVLKLVFDADAWNSTISFAPGIPVARGGTLDLTFDAGVNAATQIGRTIDLFDWTGATPTGTFTVSSPYTWDLSKLYTTGEVTLATVPGFSGDFNGNGVVDAADYLVWRKNYGTQTSYDAWRAHFGQPSGSGSGAIANAAVPEPATLVLLIFAAAGINLRGRKRA